MCELFDGNEVAISFVNVDAEFSSELFDLFPNEEIVESNAFSGKELMTIFGDWTKIFIEKLANFLIIKKNTNVSRKIRVKIGENEIELINFNSKDVNEIKTAINGLIKKLIEN